MKKHISIIISILCSLVLVIACSSDDSNDNNQNTDGDTDSAAEGENAENSDSEGEKSYANICHTDLKVGEMVPLVTGLKNSEGIAFDGKGFLYASHGKDEVIKVSPDGKYEKFADVPASIGMAFDAKGDLIVCSFGEDGIGHTRDGKLYRVKPDGTTTVFNENDIENPNFVTRTPWGTWLVSDDYNDVNEIWEVTDDGVATIWTKSVISPNGMVFSLDKSKLFVAATFVEKGGPVYAVDVQNEKAITSEIWVDTDKGAVNDGVGMDVEGNLYVIGNIISAIYRFTPDKKKEIITDENIKNPASLAFGEGEGFDPCSIYVTELFSDKIWRIAVGIPGQPLYK